MLTDFEKLPAAMQNEYVRRYHEILSHKKASLFAKRIFDIFASFIMLVLLSPVLLVVAVIIKFDSKGPVFYRQKRYTKNMRKFRIFKFRSMVKDADKRGPLVTVSGDARITKIGRFLRKTRIDEFPQLFNILLGDMSFVGTRPEVEKFVERYSDEMLATFLMPAGVTSRTSIEFMDEAEVLKDVLNADEVYVSKILPQKMKINLLYIEQYSFWGDIRIMFSTVFAIGR